MIELIHVFVLLSHLLCVHAHSCCFTHQFHAGAPRSRVTSIDLSACSMCHAWTSNKPLYKSVQNITHDPHQTLSLFQPSPSHFLAPWYLVTWTKCLRFTLDVFFALASTFFPPANDWSDLIPGNRRFCLLSCQIFPSILNCLLHTLHICLCTCHSPQSDLFNNVNYILSFHCTEISVSFFSIRIKIKRLTMTLKIQQTWIPSFRATTFVSFSH